MKNRFSFLAMTCLLALAAVIRAQPAPGRWERILSRDAGEIRQFAVDAKGTVWTEQRGLAHVVSNGRLEASYLPGNPSVQRIQGGAQSGVYAFAWQPADAPSLARVYRLEGGEATALPATPMPKGYSSYVSESGRVFLWAENMLTVWDGAAWHSMATNFVRSMRSVDSPLVLDNGQRVWLLFKDKLYWLDEDNKLTERNISLPIDAPPNGVSIQAVLLGEDTLLIVDRRRSSSFTCFSLKTGSPVAGHGLAEASAPWTVRKLIRARDGSVLLVARPRAVAAEPADGPAGWGFVVIRPDFTVAPRPGDYGLDAQSFPHVLHATDESLWSASPGRIVRGRPERTDAFGWRDGYSGRAGQLAEGSGGRIYALTSAGLFAFTPDVPAAPPPAAAEAWQEVRCSPRGFFPCPDGSLWFFLPDQPGKISLWDGAAWTHVPVPFDDQTPGTLTLHGDDRGHLLVHVHGVGIESFYDVSAQGVEQRDDRDSLWQTAARSGMRFAARADTGAARAVVTDDGRIACAPYDYTKPVVFDGQQWVEYSLRSGAAFVQPSSDHGFLLATSEGKYYAVEGPQLKLVKERGAQGGRWMLGPGGVQPYEAALVEKAPDAFLPLAARDGQFLLAPADRLAAVDAATALFGAAHVWPARHGGYFTNAQQRILGTLIFPADLSNAPIEGLSNVRVVEDKAGNLWCNLRSGVLYMRRPLDVQLKLFHAPEKIGLEADLMFKISLLHDDPKSVRIFWRLKGKGPWQGGDPGYGVKVQFPAAGEYEVEFLGVDRLGGSMAQPLVLKLKADGR